MNNKGFTLVELLATMALLAVLMIMAVPNVIGVVQRNKNKTYVEDAKKLVSLAEYKVRSKSDYKPGLYKTYCFELSFLGVGNFDQGPNGGQYDPNYSFVKVYYDGSILTYTVTLLENKNANVQGSSVDYVGISGIESTNLYKENATTNVRNFGSSPQGTCSNTEKPY